MGGNSVYHIKEEHRQRKTAGAKTDEVTGEWRQFHGEELHDLCDTQNVIRAMKARRMRWAVHVAHIGAKKNRIQGFRGRGKPEGENAWKT